MPSAGKESLREKRGKLRVQAMGDEPDWKSLVVDLGAGSDGGTGSMALLRYFDDQIKKRFAMYHSGYWVATGETIISVMVNRNDSENIRKNVEGVKFFSKLLTPQKIEKAPSGTPKMIMFGIFEHSLSQSGSFRLEVAPDLSLLQLSITSYGRYNLRRKFSSVEEAITYISKHHWYGDGTTSYNDDDDE